MRKVLLLILTMVFAIVLTASASANEPYGFDMQEITGPNGSSVSWPELTGGDPGIAAKVSAAIRQTAEIDSWLERMDGPADSARKVTVTYDYAMDDPWDGTLLPCCSVLITAMETEDGVITDQRYYPLTFDLATGEHLPFDRLCTDPEHARQWIGDEVANRVAEEIAPCVRRGSLLPVPFERYFISGQGDIVLCYEREQLEFVSGRAGAVAFLYDELWEDLDTDMDGAPIALMWLGPKDHAYANRYDPDFDMTEGMGETMWNLYLYGMTNDIPLGTPLEDALEMCHGSIREGSFGGDEIWIETEHPQMRGTYLITDRNRQRVTGIWSTRINDGGFVTGVSRRSTWLSILGQPGRNSLEIDEAAAERFLTVPGVADVYAFPFNRRELDEDDNAVIDLISAEIGENVEYVLFSDENRILHGILFRFGRPGVSFADCAVRYEWEGGDAEEEADRKSGLRQLDWRYGDRGLTSLRITMLDGSGKVYKLDSFPPYCYLDTYHDGDAILMDCYVEMPPEDDSGELWGEVWSMTFRYTGGDWRMVWITDGQDWMAEVEDGVFRFDDYWDDGTSWQWSTPGEDRLTAFDPQRMKELIRQYREVFPDRMEQHDW